MTSLQSVVCTLPGYIVYFAAALLTGAELTVMLLFFRSRQAGVHAVMALIHFLLWFCFLSVLLNYSYNAEILGLTGFQLGFEKRLFAAPWLLYASAELVSALAVGLHVRILLRIQRTRPVRIRSGRRWICCRRR